MHSNLPALKPHTQSNVHATLLCLLREANLIIRPCSSPSTKCTRKMVQRTSYHCPKSLSSHLSPLHWRVYQSLLLNQPAPNATHVIYHSGEEHFQQVIVSNVDRFRFRSVVWRGTSCQSVALPRFGCHISIDTTCWHTLLATVTCSLYPFSGTLVLWLLACHCIGCFT